MAFFRPLFRLWLLFGFWDKFRRAQQAIFSTTSLPCSKSFPNRTGSNRPQGPAPRQRRERPTSRGGGQFLTSEIAALVVNFFPEKGRDFTPAPKPLTRGVSIIW